MKIDIETLKDTFTIGYDTYIDSREEAQKVDDYYHNRQWSSDQKAILENRGQPKETFNIIKLFSRQLVGYYSTVMNTIMVNPRQQSDILTASLLNDVTKYIFDKNSFKVEGDKIKLDGFLSGLFCSYVDVTETGATDEFGRKFYDITMEHVPSCEIVLDPMSTRADYKDARYIHRFKWMSAETVNEMFPGKEDELTAYYNHLNVNEAEFEFKYNEQFQGTYKQFDNYLIVHTVIKDDKGDTWSVYWSDDTILDKKKITYKEVKFPYRVVKLNDSNKAEYYGVFREVMESQDAINQALIQIQMMSNTNKVLVEDDAVENIENFTKAYSRVNGVIPVNYLSGIKIEKLSGEIQQQYIIIDKAFDRIQRILGINDSFLGMAFASDSGRKVKLQQNATIMALRYIDNKLDLYYKLVGWDTVNLIKQYYTATQALRIVDETVGERWIQINQPIMIPGPDMSPRPVYEEELDPETGEPLKDENGFYVLTPLSTMESDIPFSDVDLEVVSVNYNDEDEKNQLMLENVLNGNTGQALMTVNPGGYMKAAALSVKTMKTKHSMDIAQILEQTAQMLQPQPQQQNQLGAASPDVSSQQPGMSKELKLPDNTNQEM